MLMPKQHRQYTTVASGLYVCSSKCHPFLFPIFVLPRLVCGAQHLDKWCKPPCLPYNAMNDVFDWQTFIFLLSFSLSSLSSSLLLTLLNFICIGLVNNGSVVRHQEPQSSGSSSSSGVIYNVVADICWCTIVVVYLLEKDKHKHILVLVWHN